MNVHSSHRQYMSLYIMRLGTLNIGERPHSIIASFHVPNPTDWPPKKSHLNPENVGKYMP